MKKLSDYLPITGTGLFTAFNNPIWATSFQDSEELDTYFYLRYGDRIGNKLIDNAKETIYIPTFLITHNDITNALIRAKQRNIDVKIIIDANSVNTRNSKHALLRELDIPLKTEFTITLKTILGIFTTVKKT